MQSATFDQDVYNTRTLKPARVITCNTPAPGRLNVLISRKLQHEQVPS